MTLQLSPRLVAPDDSAWNRCFPNGLGHCIFASPGFQRLMAQELGPPWQSRFLEVPVRPGKRSLLLPVFARIGRWGRVEITVRPIPYYVAPLDADTIDDATVRAVMEAVQTPRTAGFTWWLPPWFDWRPAAPPGRRWLGRLDLSFNEVYLITLDGTVKDHYARHVSHSQQERIRASYRRGLEIIDRPSVELIDEYYRLYLRVREEEKWSGYQYPYSLVRGIATELGDAGRLYVMKFKGQLVGGGALVFDRHAVTYFHGVMDRRCREVFPHYVLCDLAFKEAEARGVRHIDLGCVGPDNEGLKFFKKSWGAVPTPAPVLRWRFDGPPLIRRAFGAAAGLVHHIKKSLVLPHGKVLHEP